jgi:hypothetical protein
MPPHPYISVYILPCPASTVKQAETSMSGVEWGKWERSYRLGLVAEADFVFAIGPDSQVSGPIT